MKSNHSMQGFGFGILVVLAIHLALSCREDSPAHKIPGAELVKDSVSGMMANIASDITNNGPAAWLYYFEDTTSFFMASDGQLAFKDHQSAKLFIEDTLVKVIRHINLRWSHLRIDSLTPRLASIGADFHEDLTDTVGKIVAMNGYFTALADQTDHGWRLRNAHWSIVK